MSYNVFKELVYAVDCTATCGEYKNAVSSLIKENLRNIENSYSGLKVIGNDGTSRHLSCPTYRVTLQDVKDDLDKARVHLRQEDRWQFDYVSFERHIIGAFKRVMWSRMNYSDVVDIRSGRERDAFPGV